jgi:hypothetical protein
MVFQHGLRLGTGHVPSAVVMLIESTCLSQAQVVPSEAAQPIQWLAVQEACPLAQCMVGVAGMATVR